MKKISIIYKYTDGTSSSDLVHPLLKYRHKHSHTCLPGGPRESHAVPKYSQRAVTYWL